MSRLQGLEDSRPGTGKKSPGVRRAVRVPRSFNFERGEETTGPVVVTAGAGHLAPVLQQSERPVVVVVAARARPASARERTTRATGPR